MIRNIAIIIIIHPDKTRPTINYKIKFFDSIMAQPCASFSFKQKDDHNVPLNVSNPLADFLW